MATTHVPMTAEQFDAMPAVEDGLRYELLDGELIEVSAASWKHNVIAAFLMTFLNGFLLRNPIAVVAQNSEFAIGRHRLQPDVAILSKDKSDRVGEGRTPIRELPGIAVEIVSPSESAVELERKIAVYLEGGVKEIWAIYSATEHLFVHTKSGAKLFDRDAVIETPILPGWSLKVSEIFRN